jgi:hypothetical protein
MTQESGVLAVYKYLDDLIDVMEAMKSRGDFQGHEVFSPTSYHDIEHAGGFSSSPVKWFTLIGACIGTFVGFALPLLTDYDWPIVVGGKTAGIASLPAYVIIGFELTILLGGIATIGGMLIMGRIPNPKATILDRRFTSDHFGVYVPNVNIDSTQAELLKKHGAIELRRVEFSR